MPSADGYRIQLFECSDPVSTEQHCTGPWHVFRRGEAWIRGFETKDAARDYVALRQLLEGGVLP